MILIVLRELFSLWALPNSVRKVVSWSKFTEQIVSPAAYFFLDVCKNIRLLPTMAKLCNTYNVWHCITQSVYFTPSRVCAGRTSQNITPVHSPIWLLHRQRRLYSDQTARPQCSGREYSPLLHLAVQHKWIRTQPSQQNIDGHGTLRTRLSWRQCFIIMSISYKTDQWYEDEETFRHCVML